MALKVWASGERPSAADLNNNFTLAAGYVLTLNGSGSGSPADGATYFMVEQQTFINSTASDIKSRIYIPKAGLIKAVYGSVNVSATLGSNENVTIALRLNNTTDINITTTAQFTAASNPFNNASLNQAVAAGDYLEFKVVCPTWATNPTGCGFAAAILISN